MLRFMLGVCPYDFISSAVKLVEIFRVDMVFKRIGKTYSVHHTHTCVSVCLFCKASLALAPLAGNCGEQWGKLACSRWGDGMPMV